MLKALLQLKSLSLVRFHYKRELDNSDTHLDVDAHLKAAYVQLDREAVALIRILAESELSDQSIN